MTCVRRSGKYCDWFGRRRTWLLVRWLPRTARVVRDGSRRFLLDRLQQHERPASESDSGMAGDAGARAGQ